MNRLIKKKEFSELVVKASLLWRRTQVLARKQTCGQHAGVSAKCDQCKLIERAVRSTNDLLFQITSWQNEPLRSGEYVSTMAKMYDVRNAVTLLDGALLDGEV